MAKNPAIVDEAKFLRAIEEYSAGPVTAQGVGDTTGLWGKLKNIKGLKGAGASILGFMILQRLINQPAEAGERNVQREAIQAQGTAITPENLYYQAALPQAQEEESEARQALFSQLSGGVIGPSLPRGYRIIGRQ